MHLLNGIIIVTQYRRIAMRRWNLIPIAVTLFLLLLIAACSEENGRNTTVNDIYVPVKIYEAHPVSLDKTLDLSAKLVPIQQADIGPQFSAWVKKLLVKEGDRVRKGQLLVVLDDSQAKQAYAQYDAARKEYERIKALKESGAVTQQQLDRVKAAYEAAQAGYELAGSNTNIRAPFDGVVSNITVEIGEAFSPMSMSPTGKPSLLSVLKIDSMKAEVNVSDAQLEKISVGQRCLIEVDAYHDTVFEGRVINIEPAADPKSGTFKVIIAIPNKEGRLKPGFYARVGIVIDSKENIIVIPQDAVVGDTLVFLAKGNKARASRVKIAFQTEKLAAIESGIAFGDSVITDGVIGLFDGAEIRVSE